MHLRWGQPQRDGQQVQRATFIWGTRRLPHELRSDGLALPRRQVRGGRPLAAAGGAEGSARGGAPVAARAAKRPREWFEARDSEVKFGALAPLETLLAGPAGLASSWLLGHGEGLEAYDSVDRLIMAARPAGAKVKRAPAGKEGARAYELELPGLDIFGLGRARSTIQMWGAVRLAGGPQGDGGPFLEIGSEGGPRAVIEIAGGQELPFPRFDLQVRGALGIEGEGEGRSRVTGWISVEVAGEAPRIGFFAPPEEVLRGAAKEVCAQTVGFATRRLVRDLSHDFAKWRGEQAQV